MPLATEESQLTFALNVEEAVARLSPLQREAAFLFEYEANGAGPGDLVLLPKGKKKSLDQRGADSYLMELET